MGKGAAKRGKLFDCGVGDFVYIERAHRREHCAGWAVKHGKLRKLFRKRCMHAVCRAQCCKLVRIFCADAG